MTMPVAAVFNVQCQSKAFIRQNVVGHQTYCTCMPTVVTAMDKQPWYGFQIFEGESVFHYPQSPSAEVEVPMALKKDAAVTVMIKVTWHVNEMH